MGILRGKGKYTKTKRRRATYAALSILAAVSVFLIPSDAYGYSYSDPDYIGVLGDVDNSYGSPLHSYSNWFPGVHIYDTSGNSTFYNGTYYQAREHFYVFDGYGNITIVPIVAFTRNAELMVDVKLGTHLIYIKHLVKTIQQYDQVVLSAEQAKQIIEKLRTANIAGRQQRKTHRKNIKSALASDREAVKNGICPKCGGAIVQRNGKYGPFKSCSNFPK